MNALIKLFLFAVVSATWGTTWLAMKIAGETIPPLFATGLRFLAAAPLLLLALKISGSPLLFPKGQRGFQVMVCLFYFTLPFSLMLYGEIWVSSGLASVIFAMMPVAVSLASAVLLKEKVSAIQSTGLALALVALVSILINESGQGLKGQLIGILMLLSAVIMHAIMYAQCKKRCCQVPVLTFNALPCLGGGLLLTLTGWLTEHPVVSQISEKSLLAVIYLGAFAGVFGILSYFMLQKRASAFQASIVFLIFPVIALSLENALYGKLLAGGTLLLMVPLAGGIFLTLFGQQLPKYLSLKSAPVSQSVRLR